MLATPPAISPLLLLPHPEVSVSIHARRTGLRHYLRPAVAVAALGLATVSCSSTSTPASTGNPAGGESPTATTGAGAQTSTPAATSATTDNGGKATIQAVASIDAWGSILSQLGGDRVQTTSIISSPDVDPHDYEPTTADGRTIADAKLVLENGIGYDSWMAKAAAANPAPGRSVIDVGQLVGVKDGGNPHQWYSHDAVYKVIDAITTSLQHLDPANADYFAAQKTTLETVAFKQYNDLEQQISSQYKGAPVGASESIASPLADSVGLDMRTPYSFLSAISEGTDPRPRDIAQVNSQISEKKIRVYLDNVQNSTPDVARQVTAAEKAGIPIVKITETLSPENASFQDWQSGQLSALKAALAKGQ